MQLSSTDLFLLSNCAISAAFQAGNFIARQSRQQLSVQSKTGRENLASQVVTEVDHYCQSLIVQTLHPTCERFDIALLAEESADDRMRLLKEHFWSIDPLDGTLPFIESTSGYAVSIALVSRAGTPLIGVIYDPVTQTLYHAIKGAGAFRNAKLWTLEHPSLSQGQPLTIISDRSFVQQNDYSKVIAQLQAAATELGFDGLKKIQHGGAAMNACWTLENSPGCYFKFPKTQDGGGSLWDYSATACLFSEIGAIVCDIHGAHLDLNRSDSTFMNHRGIIYSSDQAIADRIRAIYIKLSAP